MNAIVCNASLWYRGRDSIGCILVIILYKSGVAECLCHFAGKLPPCNNSVAICERTFCSKSIKFWLNSSAWIAQMSTLFWSCCSLQTLALLVLDKHNKVHCEGSPPTISCFKAVSIPSKHLILAHLPVWKHFWTQNNNSKIRGMHFIRRTSSPHVVHLLLCQSSAVFCDFVLFKLLSVLGLRPITQQSYHSKM